VAPLISEAGQSAIVVPVYDADCAVSPWRQRYDRSALLGMPAHITVLYPFLDEPLLTGQVLERLRQDAAMSSAIEIRFSRMARFPGYLYLKPEPVEGLRALICQFADRWPQTPRYGEAQQPIVPHLTVAESTNAVLDVVEKELESRLPFSAVLNSIELRVFDGQRWRIKEQFLLSA